MGKKSSASLKRKRSKHSSKAKGSSKSKSRKYKSKKVRCREVSPSSSNYDDSKSLETSASSSSEDSYRTKKDRSRSAKDVKGGKKKARRRSYSSDSSEDYLYARKRKKAKRKSEYEVREKPYKKRIRMEASVSSARNGSWSCSTCHGGSGSSDDSEYESRRARLERKEKDKRKLERGRSGSEKSSRYRARSCSRCSHSSESSYERTEENYVGENNSRRLRSIITVAKEAEAEESREFSRNETKEEIVDDHDYPCRSNDSNDGVTKRELDHHTLPATEEKFRVEDEIGDVNADCAGTSESMKNKTSEASEDNLNGDDLESILRQKALENLRKFRGGIQSTAKASDQKNKIVSQVKQPITDNHDVVQGKSNVNNAAVGTKFDNQTFVEESRTNKPESTTPESCHDSLRSHLSLQQKPVSGLSQEKLAVAESSKDRGEACSNDNVDSIRGLSSAVSKPSSHGPNFRDKNLNKGQDVVQEHSQFELKQTSASSEPPNVKLPATEGGVERDEAKTAQAAIQSTNNSGKDVDELSNSTTIKSCIENSSVENNSGTLQDGSNQGSQFEQKTMNVMRGGEMVQVSYKVYIPKKAPALARRQLKR